MGAVPRRAGRARGSSCRAGLSLWRRLFAHHFLTPCSCDTQRKQVRNSPNRRACAVLMSCSRLSGAGGGAWLRGSGLTCPCSHQPCGSHAALRPLPAWLRIAGCGGTIQPSTGSSGTACWLCLSAAHTGWLEQAGLARCFLAFAQRDSPGCDLPGSYACREACAAN